MNNLLETERTIVQLVLIDETGDSYYRMRWPGKLIAEQAPNWRVLSLDANAEERFEWALKADLLVLFQSHDWDLLPILAERRARGKKTLVEYNDHFYDPPVASPVYEAWSSPLVWSAYERIMNEADGLIVTGPGLADLFKTKTNKPIYQIKNQLPDSQLRDFENMWPDTSKEIRLGWGGSQGHLPDLFAYLPAIRTLMAEFPQLKLYLMGNKAIPGYLHLPPERVHFVDWGSMRQYFQFLESLHLGFAPLLNTPYNRCRSDIKAVEMSSRGVLPLLPNALPYEDFLSRTNGTAFQNPTEFIKKVRELLEDPSGLRAQAEAAYDYVKAERLQHQHRDRLELCLQYMYEGSSEFDSGRPKGYLEIRGTPSQGAKFRETLIQVQTLFNNKKRAEAFQLLEREIVKNPLNPELALAQLKLLRLIQFPGLSEKCANFVQRFSDDLRFRLYELDCKSELQKKFELWSDLLRILSAGSPHYKRFYRNMIVVAAVKQLIETKEFLDIAKDISELYPTSARLRLELARAYEYRSEWKAALSEFEWLREHQAIHSQAAPSIGELNKMEIESFAQAYEFG